MPADVGGSDATAPDHAAHLLGYRIRRNGPTPPLPHGLELTNELGTIKVDVIRPDQLLVPSAKKLEAPPPPPLAPGLVDHFQCYRITRAKTRLKGLTVHDQINSLTTDVKRPRRLCVPVDKNGETPGASQHTTALTCYDTRIAKSSLPFHGEHNLYVTDQFGSVTLERLRSAEVCIPTVLP